MLGDDDDIIDSIVLFDRPMDREGWSAEEVVLARTASGDVIMRIDSGGRAAQMYVGDLYGGERSIYRISGPDVPRLLAAALRERFADTHALVEWTAARSLATEPSPWHGFAARPTNEDRFLLEVLRDVIGTADRDEGSKFAGRLGRWLRANDVPFSAAHQAVPFD